MPSVSNNDKDITIHDGHYQMPLFIEKVPEKAPFTYEAFIQAERIPTASVLIRVHRNTKDGRPQKAPFYTEGSYSTLYHIVTDEEKEAMDVRRRQYTPMVGDTMELFLRHFGVDPANIPDREGFLSKLV